MNIWSANLDPNTVVETAHGRTVQVGSIIGSYRLLSLLGTGGAGKVFFAEHVRLGRKVALKVASPTRVEDEQFMRRFYQEARTVNRIRHRNIVEITDFVEDRGVQGLVMEFVDGKTLDEFVEHASLEQLRLFPRLQIARQIASALKAAHTIGVVHRDLKPTNIMVVESGKQHFLVKLLDFGAAKVLPGAVEGPGDWDPVQTRRGMVIGTPGYMAPEQMLDGQVDRRSDIYAFGVVLYLLLSGELPFPARTMGEMMREQLRGTPRPLSELSFLAYTVPQPLEALIKSCLKTDPWARPQTMAEVAGALDRVVETSMSTPRAKAFPTRGDSTPRLVWVSALTALVVGLCGGLAAAIGPSGSNCAKAEQIRTVVTRANALPAMPMPPATEPKTRRIESSPQKVRAVTSRNRSHRVRRSRRSRANKAALAARKPVPSETLAEAAARQLFAQANEQLRRHNGAEAAAFLREAIGLSPEFAPAFRALGMANVLLGNPDRARMAFEEFLRLDPSHPDAAAVRDLIHTRLTP